MEGGTVVYMSPLKWILTPNPVSKEIVKNMLDDLFSLIDFRRHKELHISVHTHYSIVCDSQKTMGKEMFECARPGK